MSRRLQTVTETHLPQEFVEVFNILKPDPTSYFQLILIPIHWGLASCGLDLVNEKSESISLDNIYTMMNTNPDGIQSLELHYLSNRGILWKLKVTETEADQKIILMGVPLNQKQAVWNWKTPKKYVLDVGKYIMDIDGNNAEDIYSHEAVESFGTLLMHDLNGEKRVLRSQSSYWDSNSNASGELVESLTQGESGADQEADDGDDEGIPRRSKRVKSCK